MNPLPLYDVLSGIAKAERSAQSYITLDGTYRAMVEERARRASGDAGFFPTIRPEVSEFHRVRLELERHQQRRRNELYSRGASNSVLRAAIRGECSLLEAYEESRSKAGWKKLLAPSKLSEELADLLGAKLSAEEMRQRALEIDENISREYPRGTRVAWPLIVQ